MKVKELKEKLKNFSDEMEIVLSSDPEGNGFYWLCDVESDYMFDDGDLICEEDYDGDNWEKEDKVIVLWP